MDSPRPEVGSCNSRLSVGANLGREASTRAGIHGVFGGVLVCSVSLSF